MTFPEKDKAHRRQCKMSSSKKIYLWGSLRQVIIIVYILEIVNFLCTYIHVGILNLALGSVLSCVAPLLFSLVQLFHPTPLPCVNKYTVILYTRIQCVRGRGFEVLGLRQINNWRKVPLKVNFFKWPHFTLVSIVHGHSHFFAYRNAGILLLKKVVQCRFENAIKCRDLVIILTEAWKQLL